MIELEDQPQYQNLTTTPVGEFILADYCNFVKVKTSIRQAEIIPSPIEMDFIEFKNWRNSKLEFTCDEFMNWDKHLTMTYDYETNSIEIKNVI